MADGEYGSSVRNRTLTCLAASRRITMKKCRRQRYQCQSPSVVTEWSRATITSPRCWQYAPEHQAVWRNRWRQNVGKVGNGSTGHTSARWAAGIRGNATEQPRREMANGHANIQHEYQRVDGTPPSNVRALSFIITN